MSSLSAPSAALAAPAPAAPAQATFGLQVVVGLFGVLLAVLCAGLNESVTKISLADIRGAMGIGADEGAWLLAVYSAASVSAMAFAPWLATTFSLRRFTLCAIGLFALLGLLQPFAPNLHSLMLLRVLQGFASGALPPMLMSVALRFLPPGIKVYGLACYALTATFGPNLGTPLAGCGPNTSAGDGRSGRSSCPRHWRWPVSAGACRRTRFAWSASSSSTGVVCCSACLPSVASCWACRWATAGAGSIRR